MSRSVVISRLIGALLVWLSTWGATGVIDVMHCRTRIHVGLVLGSRQPDAILAAWDWGWESRFLEAATSDRQRTQDSCGPAALQRIFRMSRRPAGRPADASTHQRPGRMPWLATEPMTHGSGCTLADLQSAAARLGLRTRLLATRHLSDITPPAILHLRRGHFVVLEARGQDSVRVFDPACGVIRTGANRLSQQWSGAVLQFVSADRARPLLAVHP